MYWTGVQYQKISCNEKKTNSLIIALDPVKLKNLKKITQIDTISRKSIGIVHYVKLSREKIEFYTSDGFHPIDLELRLKPMTPYIYEKYILKIQVDSSAN